MTATDRGAFCQNCSTEVVDFSAMTDSELLSFFAGGKTGCGRFRTDQVGVPITSSVLHNGPTRWRAVFFSLLPFLSLRVAATPDQYRRDLVATDMTMHPQPLATHTTQLPLITEVEREPVHADTTVYMPEVTAVGAANHLVLGLIIQGIDLPPLPEADGHTPHRRGHATQFLSPKKERKHWLRRFLRLSSVKMRLSGLSP